MCSVVLSVSEVEQTRDTTFQTHERLTIKRRGIVKDTFSQAYSMAFTSTASRHTRRLASPDRCPEESERDDGAWRHLDETHSPTLIVIHVIHQMGLY